METYVFSSEDATRDFVKKFTNDLIKVAVQGESKVIALSGDLGTGKTFFVKALAEEFGITETITSPTFVLARFYYFPEKLPWKRLIHIDAYRLKDEVDLIKLGWDEWVADPGNLICVEWPEQVFSDDHMKKFTRLYFGWVNENSRSVRV